MFVFTFEERFGWERNDEDTEHRMQMHKNNNNEECPNEIVSSFCRILCRRFSHQMFSRWN